MKEEEKFNRGGGENIIPKGWLRYIILLEFRIIWNGVGSDNNLENRFSDWFCGSIRNLLISY